jgi:ABC-type nitrate/sulfonate/bicarbonate transport system permease component
MPANQERAAPVTAEPGTPAPASPPAAAPNSSTRRPRRPRRWLTIRDEPGPLERTLIGAFGVAVLLLVWHVLTMGEPGQRIIDPYTLPGIGETVASFRELWFDRALMRGALASLGRVFGGFLLAAAVAVPLGVVAGCYTRLNAFLRPLSIFGRNVPIAALIPLTLIWFGLGETQKVMFIFLASVAFIFFDTAGSVRAVPGNFLDTAYTLGARMAWQRGLRVAAVFGGCYALAAVFGSQLMDAGETALVQRLSRPATWLLAAGAFLAGTALWLPVFSHQAIGKVLFPLSLPAIVNSLRLLFGIAFGYIVLAEVINAKFGLGNIIIVSQRRGPREHIYLCLILIALLAFLIDRAIQWGQRHAFPYVTDAED